MKTKCATRCYYALIAWPHAACELLMLFTEVQCPAYKAFPTGVEGGSSDPCKPAASFQLSSTTDPSCSLKCKAGYEQKGGEGRSTLQCGKDGKLSGELTCTGE